MARDKKSAQVRKMHWNLTRYKSLKEKRLFWTSVFGRSARGLLGHSHDQLGTSLPVPGCWSGAQLAGQEPPLDWPNPAAKPTPPARAGRQQGGNRIPWAGFYHCLRTRKPDGKRPRPVDDRAGAASRQDLLMLQEEKQLREGIKEQGGGEQGLARVNRAAGTIWGWLTPLGMQREEVVEGSQHSASCEPRSAGIHHLQKWWRKLSGDGWQF